jgi:hypothetical protein
VQGARARRRGLYPAEGISADSALPAPSRSRSARGATCRRSCQPDNSSTMDAEPAGTPRQTTARVSAAGSFNVAAFANFEQGGRMKHTWVFSLPTPLKS